ncbi:MAG: GIY-YIG nuclease family protein [Bacteroidetes bacterium]|nr:GIY-YIG nuclease family protein [Bacteroidota bacterium]
MNNITENIRWLHLGNLSNFKTSDVSGCYVFVYDNKRIIYVGTTSNIGKRLLYHLEAIKSGRRPI